MFEKKDKTGDVLSFVLKTVIAVGVLFTLAIAVWKLFDYLKARKNEEELSGEDDSWLTDEDFSSISDDLDVTGPFGGSGETTSENA